MKKKYIDLVVKINVQSNYKFYSTIYIYISKYMLFVSILFPYMVTAVIGFLLVGLGVSSVVPLIYSLAGKSGTMQPGLALAAVSSISFLGFLIGPPLIGFIAEAAGLRFSFALIAVIGLFPAILANKVKES